MLSQILALRVAAPLQCCDGELVDFVGEILISEDKLGDQMASLAFPAGDDDVLWHF